MSKALSMTRNSELIKLIQARVSDDWRPCYRLFCKQARTLLDSKRAADHLCEKVRCIIKVDNIDYSSTFQM